MNDVLREMISEFRSELKKYNIDFELTKHKSGDIWFLIDLPSIYRLESYIAIIFHEENLGLSYYNLNAIEFKQIFTNINDICEKFDFPPKVLIYTLIKAFSQALDDKYDIETHDLKIEIRRTLYQDDDSLFRKPPSGDDILDSITYCMDDIKETLAIIFNRFD